MRNLDQSQHFKWDWKGLISYPHMSKKHRGKKSSHPSQQLPQTITAEKVMFLMTSLISVNSCWDLPDYIGFFPTEKNVESLSLMEKSELHHKNIIMTTYGNHRAMELNGHIYFISLIRSELPRNITFLTTIPEINWAVETSYILCWTNVLLYFWHWYSRNSPLWRDLFPALIFFSKLFQKINLKPKIS